MTRPICPTCRRALPGRRRGRGRAASLDAARLAAAEARRQLAYVKETTPDGPGQEAARMVDLRVDAAQPQAGRPR